MTTQEFNKSIVSLGDAYEAAKDAVHQSMNPAGSEMSTVLNALGQFRDLAATALQNARQPENRTDDEVKNAVVHDILVEVARAEFKHPSWPTDKVYGAAIVSEESGEVMRACVQFEMEGGKVEEVSKELIQTAAVCIRMLSSIEYSEIARHEQH